MSDLKTKPTRKSVARFLAGIKDPELRRDARAVAAMMRAATRSRAQMWGPSIVGFGRYAYKYPSGHTGEWFVAGFAPRPPALVLYLLAGLRRYPELLAKLGPHKKSVGCLYIRRLAEVHQPTLKALIQRAVRDLRARSKPQA